MSSWRMFIASSTRGFRYAQAIKSVIDKEFNAPVCFLWSQGAFETGKSFLDSLEQLPDKYNCGLAVFTADDHLGNLMAPRDNVVLEFGLFLGVFGRGRSFLLVEDRKDLKLPTDYEGITQSRFYPAPGEAKIEDLRSHVHDACIGIVERLKCAERVRHHPEPLRRIEENWRRNHPGEEFKLYSFYGLNDKQDSATAGSNEEEVYFLWADAGAGSTIQARVLDEERRPAAEREHILRIEFHNQPNSFPGNVAVRLRRQSVVSIAPNRFRRLWFSARIAPLAKSRTAAASPVCIGLRVVDALTTHWEYSRVAHEYRLMTLNPGAGWQEFEVLLDNAGRWSVFPSDGNYLYHDKAPDFSQILAVVVEVGGKGKGRPGAGFGTIDLKDFRLE